MLDIGIIIPELAKYGGAERYLVECLICWQDKHRITVYASEFNFEMLTEHGVRDAVQLVKLSARFDGTHATVLNGTLLPKIWEQEIGHHDIYHSHLWPTHLVNLHPMVWFPHEPLRMINDLRFNQHIEEFAEQFARKLHLYPKHTYDFILDSWYEGTMRALAQFDKTGHPDRIVANSRYTASYLEKVYGRPVTDVVYPGVTPEDFVHMRASDNVVLTVGQLWPHKRIRLLIESVSLVAGVELYVVGSGPDRDLLQSVAHNLGVEDRVFFLQGLDNNDVQALFARAMCLVFTPTREPFGIVALEAMAAGKPLIAVNEGGYVEVVGEDCAMLVPPRPIAIAEKIEALRADPDLRRRMGAAGIERAKNYTWSRTAQELLAVVEDEHARYQGSQPTEAASDREGPLVGIHYYGWYGEGFGNAHWNDTPDLGGVTDMPSLGYYGSTDGDIIDQHFDWIEAACIDFVIMNLHVDENGTNPRELAAYDTILRKASAAERRLKFAIALCPYTDSLEALERVITFIRTAFARQRHYLRYDGKPALFIFWTGNKDGDDSFIRFLDEETRDFVRVASTLRLYDRRTEPERTFGLFDAFSLYSPLELATADRWERVWQLAYDHSDAGRLDLRIATVSPGYDDTHLTSPMRAGNPSRRIRRDRGITYKRCWDFVRGQGNPPDMVLITSMNEYHENTHIEPSRDRGAFYLDMTREEIARMRAPRCAGAAP